MSRTEVLEQWREEELREALAWHKANNVTMSERDIQAYTAGFNQGWRKLRANLILHNTFHDVLSESK